MSTGVLEAVIAALLGLAVGAASIFFQQRNRRHDQTSARRTENATTGAQYAENALNAWMQINNALQTQLATQALQIASLTTRLDALQGQVQNYENTIVPDLQKTIAEQQTTIGDLREEIAQQSSLIETLRDRIDKLEKAK